MNESWQALYHADVVRDFAAAKLDFACSAELCMNVNPSQLGQEQRELVESIHDPLLRETVLDYLQNTAFRTDIFIRGARRMTPARRQQWWDDLGLALTVPRRFATLGLPADETNFASAVLDVLADGPLPLRVLGERCGVAPEALANLVALLVWHDQGTPYIVDAVLPSTGSTLRFNAAVAEDAVFNDRYQALASPVLGSGVSASALQRLVYRAVREHGLPLDRAVLAQQIRRVLADQGEPIVLGLEPLPNKEAELAEIRRTVDDILTLRAPVWQQLRMI
jgi:hypothetical protein